MKEIWNDIPGLEGKYQASSKGRIKSLAREIHVVSKLGNGFQRRIRERILSPSNHSAGYLFVKLDRKNRGRPVHQLVAMAFMGMPPEGMEVLHANGNKKDNRIENLRYGTHSENSIDCYFQDRKIGRGKVTMEQVCEIRERLQNGESGKSIAQAYGVSDSTVSRIKRRESFGWLPENLRF